MLSPDSASHGAVRHPGTDRDAESACAVLDGGIVLAEANGASRGALELFVARRFREVYDARVTHFLPRLFGARDRRGRLAAVFGLRSAADGPLFLEHYLDAPIESAVEGAFGVRPSRNAIAEVGNLAGSTPGAVRSLIPALTRRLAEEGFAYVAFTGSARLCNGFARLGLPLRPVGPAALERLPPEQRGDWGRYYDSAPEVMLGDVRLGARLLEAYSRHPQVLRAQLAPLAGVGAP
jgi:hypothetical protein